MIRVGVAHTSGVMGRLIRIGEALRLKRGSEWNHAFILTEERSITGELLVIQATLRGVTSTAPLSSMGRFKLIDLPEGVDPVKVLAFATNQVGLRYGYLTILAVAIDILTWDWFPAFRGARKPSWICSALVMESLRYGGFYHNFIDVYTVTPQDAFNILT